LCRELMKGLVSTEVVFETHSTSEDNERGIATGWHQGRLSKLGREQASHLGARRADDGIAAVFSSDPGRALETVEIAFPGSDIPLLHDWRLRECDYGELNGTDASAIHRDRQRFLHEPYPGGESWRQAVMRVGSFLDDLTLRWTNRRVLIVGRTATYLGLEHYLNGTPLQELVSREFVWQEGWEYHSYVGR
jgi:2,3-bisphosphoglycerate-dependent phosphoglycerate mutase